MLKFLHFDMVLDLVPAKISAFMDILPPYLSDKLKHAATLKTYARGQMIHSRGDLNPGLSVIKSGAVHVGIYGEDGSFVMTSILGPGQVFGQFTLFAGLPRTHDMTASGVTEVYEIPARKFMELYDADPNLSKALLSTSLLRMHMLLELLDAIRRLPLLPRTAKVLSLLMQASGTDGCFKCRQSDLAFTLGVSRVSLGKALKQLEALELIELGYGEIRLRNPANMADWIAAQARVTRG